MASGSVRPEIPATPLNAAASTLVVDGRERPARNSLDQPLHWSKEGVRNFWRWFGDSQAVDGDGRPVVLFHGTKSDLAAFDINKAGVTDDGLAGKGFYFTYSADEASGYAESDIYGVGNSPNVIPAYVNVRSPLRIVAGALPDGRKVTDVHKQHGSGINAKGGAAVKKVAEESGHGEVVWMRTDGGVGHVVAFKPEQIKSAIGNSGLFDPTSAHLADPMDRPELATSMRQDIEGNDSMSSAPTTANEHNDSVVLIEPEQMAAFNKRLVALNKKAASYGLESITVLDVRDVLYRRKLEYVGRDKDQLLATLVPVRPDEDCPSPVLLKRIEMRYPIVKLGDWQVVGKIEAMPGGNLVFAVTPSAQDAAALQERAHQKIECDHCKTNRTRKDSYLLRDNASGAYMQVGSNCLEEFTGIDPARALFLARMWSMVRVLEGELQEYGQSGRTNAISTRHFLAAVSYIAQESGFVSSAKARETGQSPTYDDAVSLVFSREPLPHYEARLDQLLAMADTTRQWALNKPRESSFDHNLALILQADAISLDRKHLAFAAAAIPMYQRAMHIEHEKSQRLPSHHVGSPGQKLTDVALTVDRVVPIESVYGYADLVFMHDPQGNVYKWKTSSCPQDIRQDGVGRTLLATLKVKEHGEYKGVAQTSITHLKVTAWLDRPTESNADAQTQDEATEAVLAPSPC